MAFAFKNDLLRRSPSVSAHGLRVRGTVIFCAGAILFAMMAYMAATRGFGAIVRCELESNGALGQGRSVTSQIASSSACGF